MAKIKYTDAFDPDFIKKLEKLVKVFKELGVEARELNKAVKAAKTFKEMGAASEKAAKGVNKLTDSEKKLAAANKRLAFETSKAGKDRAVLNEQTRRATAENKKLAQSQLGATKSTNRWGVAIKSFAFKFNALGNLIAQAASTVFRAFVRAVRQSVDVIKNFDKSSARLASVLGKTRKEITKLTKEAKQLGSITQFTASQVTSLQIELAKLGFTANEISAATPGILSFATATGADLAGAAKTAGAAVRVFGLNASETEDAVATLAVATTKSGLTFEAYDTILSTAGPVAKAYGFTLEDVIALTGELATAGFEANKAATATRNILLNLADSNGALAKSLGGSVDNFDDLIDGLIQLEAQGVPLGKMLDLTDRRSVAAFGRFLEGAESARTLRDSITDVNDKLQDMVDIQLDTLAGDIDLLKSSWEGFILSMSDGGILREAVQLLTNAVLQMQNLDLATSKFHKQNTEQLTRSVALLESLTNKQGEAFSKITEAYADATAQQLMNSREDIVSHLRAIRKVNAKEAEALYGEILRQRQDQEAEEIQALINKNNRLADEEKKSAKKKVGELENVSAQIKQIVTDETETLIEENQEAVDLIIQSRDDIVSATDGAFEAMEATVKEEFDAEMDVIDEKRKAYNDYYDHLKYLAEDYLQNTQIEIGNQGFDFFTALLDRRSMSIDKQLKNGVISEEQAAEQRAKIQKRAAILEKAQSLFNIGINTAVAVTKTTAQLGAVLAAPLIPFIIGLGLAQAAVVIATPIPKYAKGVDSAKAGGAIVGEKGSELRVDPSGQMSLTPSQATYTDLQKGTKIIPADITNEILKYAAVATGMGSAKDDQLILKMMGQLDASNERLRREFKNKPIASSTLTPAGILTATHKGNTVIKKIDKYFS